jgi:hypothetical protein
MQHDSGLVEQMNAIRKPHFWGTRCFSGHYTENNDSFDQQLEDHQLEHDVLTSPILDDISYCL